MWHLIGDNFIYIISYFLNPGDRHSPNSDIRIEVHGIHIKLL